MCGRVASPHAMYSSSPSSHCRWGCSAWVGSSREAHSTRPRQTRGSPTNGPSSPRSIPAWRRSCARARLYRQVLERLRSTPGISGVGRLNCAARPVPRGAPDRSSRGETRGTALRPDLPDHRGGLFQVPRAANDPRARLHAGRGVVAAAPRVAIIDDVLARCSSRTRTQSARRSGSRRAAPPATVTSSR